MTVYNVTELLTKEQQTVLKKYLDVEKVQVMFGDWGYRFGVRLRVSKSGYLPRHRKRVAVEQWLFKKIGELRTFKDIRNCPKALLHNQRKDGN